MLHYCLLGCDIIHILRQYYPQFWRNLLPPPILKMESTSSSKMAVTPTRLHSVTTLKTILLSFHCASETSYHIRGLH